MSNPKEYKYTSKYFVPWMIYAVILLFLPTEVPVFFWLKKAYPVMAFIMFMIVCIIENVKFNWPPKGKKGVEAVLNYYRLKMSNEHEYDEQIIRRKMKKDSAIGFIFIFTFLIFFSVVFFFQVLMVEHSGSF